MKKLLGVAGVLVFAVALRVTPVLGDSALPLSNPQYDTLTPLDSVPSSQQITKVFNDSSNALTSLQEIASFPPSSGVDRGVQLRAVRALIHYCATSPCTDLDPAHMTLKNIELAYRDVRAGSDLLILRAAIESLGVLKVPADYTILTAQLQHPSRDIRATTARALRDLGNTQAIPYLRARLNIEQVDQVKTALSDALRVLDQPI
jgi:hypothetical protein